MGGALCPPTIVYRGGPCVRPIFLWLQTMIFAPIVGHPRRGGAKNVVFLWTLHLMKHQQILGHGVGAIPCGCPFFGAIPSVGGNFTGAGTRRRPGLSKKRKVPNIFLVYLINANCVPIIRTWHSNSHINAVPSRIFIDIFYQ